MYNYRFTTKYGAETVICARNKGTALRLYCESMSRTPDWVSANCTIRRL
jgi:hypothetical protein